MTPVYQALILFISLSRNGEKINSAFWLLAFYFKISHYINIAPTFKAKTKNKIIDPKS